MSVLKHLRKVGENREDWGECLFFMDEGGPSRLFKQRGVKETVSMFLNQWWAS